MWSYIQGLIGKDRINHKLIFIRTATFLVAGTIMFSSAASATSEEEADGQGRCKNVHARATSMIVTQGCKNNFVCFAGELNGSHLLNGTSKAVIFGFSPSAGLPGIEAATTMSFSGERVIVTKSGVLTLHVVGVFDTAPGALGQFGEIEKVTGGTGRFSGATGVLRLVGQAMNTELTNFEGTFSGTICLTDKD